MGRLFARIMPCPMVVEAEVEVAGMDPSSRTWHGVPRFDAYQSLQTRTLLSTGNTDSADGAPCSFRSRNFFHKVFGLSSMKFSEISRTRIEQERNHNKETRLHMRKR